VSNASPAQASDRAQAALRLQRVQWAWAIVLAAIGSLYLTPLRTSAFTHPLLSAVPYLACGALLASGLQPAVLALVAATWGFSAVLPLPSVSVAFGSDPLVVLLGSRTPATIAVVVLRLAFAATAWRQFLIYRSLYTPEAADPASTPALDRTQIDRMADWSSMLGFFSLILPVFAMGMKGVGGGPIVLQLSLILATFALGTGLGAGYSPTARRGPAVRGILLGGLGGLLTLAVGAVTNGLPAA
jgi:hypothetical protein